MPPCLYYNLPPGADVNTAKPPKMKAVLNHMVELTGHRDHMLLDTSVLAAMHELVGARQARVFDIFADGESLQMRARAGIVDGAATAFNEDGFAAHEATPVAALPALAACIEQRGASAGETGADGMHALWLPIWINDRLGTCIELKSDMPFSAQALQLIEGILSVYRNFQSLIDYSERDSLTGLFNRKTFDEKFSRMVAVAAAAPKLEAGQPERRHADSAKEHWLAVIDIDHFKRVNDTFGHLYGDEVLILVANLLRNSFRADDRIFRFGGEEFVVMLRSATLENARKAFDRLRRKVEQYPFPQVGHITLSIGFTGIRAHETPVMILGHADQALYHAKTHGRNQVCHYDELVLAGHLQSGMANDTVELF